MKKVVIFGAAGHTGKYITEKMKAEKDIELSVFVRNPAKFEGMDLAGVNIIQGDAFKKEDVKKGDGRTGSVIVLSGGRCPDHGA